jgi:thiamine biosynthesis lipoprotein
MRANVQSLLRIWLALLGLAFFVSCSHAPQQHAISGETMGTTYHVRYVSADPQHNPQRVKEAIDAVLVQVNARMSTYDPNSELSRFNQRLQTTPVVISRALEQVLRRSLEIAVESDGALDVTVGPLVNLWGFGPQPRPEKIPTDAELAAIRERVGYQLLTLENHQISKQVPELYIDLSTIAKGYGVDRVALVLEQLEIQNYLIEIGGEMRMKGSKPDDEPWRIAIEKPISTERSVQRVIELGDAAVATSGDYRNYYEQDGVRFSHIIDPHTGKPIQHNLVSVTVITDTCMDADAYATALTVMGPQRALEFAEQKQLAVLLITREADGFKEHSSSAFARYNGQ